MDNIYKKLKEDHNHHRELLEKIAETHGDSPERKALWEQFYYDVKAHAAAEEETFYAPLMEEIKGQPKARHSVTEHAEVDEMIMTLNKMDFSSSGWLSRFKKMKEEYEHHADEEENKIFDRARKIFSNDDAQHMAENFVKRKKAEMKL